MASMALSAQSAHRKPHPRFGLRTLFLATAVTAVAVAPTQWFGAAYLLSILVSLGVVAATVSAYHRGRGESSCTVSMVAVAGNFFLCVALPICFFHSLASFAGTLVLSRLKVSTRFFAIGQGAILLLVFGTVVGQGIGNAAKFYALRREYPITALDDRLEFEDDYRANGSSQRFQTAGFLSPGVAENLSALEQYQTWSQRTYRADALRRLHRESYQHFSTALGFGPVRMRRFSPRDIEIDLPPAEQLPLVVSGNLMDPIDYDCCMESGGLAFGQDSPAAVLHSVALANFVDRDALGYLPEFRRAAGFVSHRFRDLGTQLGGDQPQNARWRLIRLELVSLLRHDPPRVYQAQTLPQMDQLASHPTRDMADFERSALLQIVSKEDLVIEEQPDRILMLGAVRAASGCLDCHDATRGDLLGAFSYELLEVERKSPDPAVIGAVGGSQFSDR